MAPTIEQIVARVTKKAGTANIPWTFDELAKNMKVPRCDRRMFDANVEQAVTEGLLQGLGYQGQPLGRIRLHSSEIA